LIPKTLNPIYKGGIILPVMEVIYSNEINQKNFTLKVLKEYLLDMSVVYLFPKNYHLLNTFNEKMGIYTASGLISLWMERYLDRKYVNLEEPLAGPRTISVKDLKGSFELLIMGFIVSTTVFFVEMISALTFMKFLRRILEKFEKFSR